MVKISIIGVGNLGSCTAYEIANRGIADELVLVDIDKKRAEGEAEDIKQAVALKNKTKIVAGDYKDITESDVIVVTAGKPRTPDIKTRQELGKINSKIIKSVAEKIKENAPGSIIVTVTNPVDVMNYLMWKETGFGRERVIGAGGQLDSARFTSTLGKEGVVMGEHGDCQILLWSKVQGKYDAAQKNKIFEKIRESARDVITKKGATVYAPANTIADVVQSIVKDEKKTMMCSYVLQGEYWGRDLSLGVPVKLGFKGAEELVKWELSKEEREQFENAITEIKKNIKEILN